VILKEYNIYEFSLFSKEYFRCLKAGRYTLQRGDDDYKNVLKYHVAQTQSREPRQLRLQLHQPPGSGDSAIITVRHLPSNARETAPYYCCVVLKENDR
jgi:hypothetical protein